MNGESIRVIARTTEGWGRTKISNLIKAYMIAFPSKSSEIKAGTMKNKNYRQVEAEETLQDMSIEDILNTYIRIKNGETLTKVAKELGRSREYVKKRIIDAIDDELECQEFLEILKENQHPGRNRYLRFLDSPIENKVVTVFEKLNERTCKMGRKPYPYVLLNRKLNILKEYFLNERNDNIDDETSRLTEQNFWMMIYETPTLLVCSFEDKIKPAMENLDHNPYIGYHNATRIISEDSSILSSAISRTNLQIRIL